MCGRFTLHTEKEALAERFGFHADQLVALAPHYNVAPTQDVLAVRADPANRGGRLAALLRWGLVPSWSKAIGAQALMINARVESLARARRALAREAALPGPRRRSRMAGFRKQGALEAAPPDRARRRRAARWPGLPARAARTRGGEALVPCAITTAATGALRALHDRMPVILPREAEARWLDPALDGDTAALLALLQPVPTSELHMQPVSRRVNDVANDDPELLRRDDSEPSLGLF
jgi:putative SOS response-associated peptidase YedK